MPATRIEAIKSLKNAPVLEDLSLQGPGIQLNRWNLIYGFNGSGKTTISRILDSCSQGAVVSKLPSEITFSIGLSDGSKIESSDLENHDRRMIAVFNEDYVERSLFWSEATATPIIYIGDEQTDKAQKLEALEAEIDEVLAKEQSASEDASTSEKIFKEFCTAQARLIGEELGIARSYNATSLHKDYQKCDFSGVALLSEDQRKKLKETINQSGLPDKLNLTLAEPDLAALVSAMEAAISISIPALTIESLERRKDAIPWVKKGLDLHTNESSCLLCGNAFSNERKVSLEEAITAGFEQFAEVQHSLLVEAEKILDWCESTSKKLNVSRSSIPSKSSEMASSENVIEALLGRLIAITQQWQGAAKERLADPSQPVDFARFDTKGWQDEFDVAVTSIKEQIADNNAYIDDFDNEVGNAKLQLKNHHLCAAATEYSQKRDLADSDKKTREEFAEQLLAKRKEENALRLSMSDAALAAKVLNDYLKSYLGHQQLRLTEVDGGYQILRSNKVSEETLSEGEKTAIAFCHFMVSLSSEGRKISDTIIVIDDPISSLDTRALGHVASIIRRELDQAAQILVLTHNIDFMREVKKWLNNRFRNKPPQANFLFTEHHISHDGKRTTKVVKLPKLIREYESEYHYLYSVVKLIADNPNDFETLAYLMPNAIRKVLDIFLAFKVPGSAGLSSKVDHLIRENEKLDANRVKAMERLAQTESHSENIGDTTSFSAYTLEQISEAACTLRKLIETVDAPHYKAMDKLCA